MSRSERVANIQNLPWVTGIRQCNHDAKYNNYLVTERSSLSVNEEIHTLENMGVRDWKVSKMGSYGLRVYVRF